MTALTLGSGGDGVWYSGLVLDCRPVRWKGKSLALTQRLQGSEAGTVTRALQTGQQTVRTDLQTTKRECQPGDRSEPGEVDCNLSVGLDGRKQTGLHCLFWKPIRALRQFTVLSCPGCNGCAVHNPGARITMP